MTIERVYWCEGPDCEPATHARTATPPPHLPMGFIETRERHDLGETTRHFCSWPCLMKFAASQPIPERIEWDDIIGDNT